MLSKEEAIKKTLKEIEEMQEVNKALPAIKKVINKWNNKVFNKNLEKDLQALDLPGRVYVYTHYQTTIEIYYRPEQGNNNYTVLSGTKPGTRYYTEEKSFLGPTKRINAAKAGEIIESNRVERLQRITQYREHLETWEAKKAQIDQLKKQLNTIIGTIPYTMQDYFNMRPARY